jgi:hypothetical protein
MRRAGLIELGALDATIAVPIHDGKPFGNPLLNSPLNSCPHFCLGDYSIAINIEAQKTHRTDSAGFNGANRTVTVKVETMHHPITVAAAPL